MICTFSVKFKVCRIYFSTLAFYVNYILKTHLENNNIFGCSELMGEKGKGIKLGKCTHA